MRIRIGVATAGCVVALAACGSATTMMGHTGMGNAGLSPAAVAAHQLASADGSRAEQPMIAADLKRLNPYCVETPDELVTEISDGEQDLRRHDIRADAATMATGLLAMARAQPRGVTPTNCGQLVASYLNAHGG